MPTDQTPKQVIAQRLKDASNILVTVSHNPSVDELSAALALTLMLEKLDKAATAVFSGQIPAAIEFLEPGKTFDTNVDSLRDFIIALDKSKADRLRYKVEDDVVRVFITPYKTTITEKDLSFSQGDFNVDLIVAFGVEKREDLDTAITAHGRILHDAGVVTINQFGSGNSLGEVDWNDPEASSLCEMLMSLSEALQSGLLDQQIATAILTGLVAATDRFRNDKTSPKVMTMAAQLMAAGANQQLIAEKLESTPEVSALNTKAVSNEDAGAIKVTHEDMAAATDDAVEVKAEEVAAEESVDAVKTAEAELAAVAAPPVVTDRTPAVSPSRSGTWRDIRQPAVGGSLNETTSEAEDEAREAENDTTNRVILSHDSPSSATASVPTPPVLNATSLTDAEPTVEDIFASEPPKADPVVVPEPAPLPVPATPTPATDPVADTSLIAGASGLTFEETPVAPATNANAQVNQTLADLEAEVHRVSNPEPTMAPLDDARAAVDAALGSQPFNPSGQPLAATGAQPLGDVIHPEPVTQAEVTGLPPLPPLPDFSTLPPLPGEGTVSLGSAPAEPTPLFGLPTDANPAATNGTPVVTPSSDPGQFKLPGAS